MNKCLKRGFAVFFVLLIFTSFVSAINGDYTDITKTVEEKKTQYETEWDYLQQEWQSIFLKNKFVSWLDTQLNKIDFVFVYLFAEDYTFASLHLWLVIILWILIAVFIANIFSSLLKLNYGLALIFGAAGSVIFAQVRVFNFLAGVILKTAFDPESWWIKIIVWVMIGLGFFIFYVIGVSISKIIKAAKEQRAKQEIKYQIDKVKHFFAGLGKGGD